MNATDQIKGFVQRLNEVCDDMGLSEQRGRQTELAGKMKMVPNSARKWLLGLGLPTLDMALRIANWGNVSVLWLLQGIPPKRHGPIDVRDLVLSEALQELPSEDRELVLGLLRFRIVKAFGESSARGTRYLKAIDTLSGAQAIRRFPPLATPAPEQSQGVRFGTPTAIATPAEKRKRAA